jgi:glucose-6-phosphate 1-dehydrogenase
MHPNIESEIAITSDEESRLPILSTNSVVTEKRADTVDALNVITQEKWYKEGLVIVVVGASGDLAKKKTYPSLLDLYSANLLPRDTIIWGYARSRKTYESL